MNEENFKIKSMRVYQPVPFENVQQHSFNGVDTPNRRAVKFTVIKGIGVKIDSNKDSVLVPYTNIGSITLHQDSETEEAKKPATTKTK